MSMYRMSTMLHMYHIIQYHIIFHHVYNDIKRVSFVLWSCQISNNQRNVPCIPNDARRQLQCSIFPLLCYVYIRQLLYKKHHRHAHVLVHLPKHSTEIRLIPFDLPGRRSKQSSPIQKPCCLEKIVTDDLFCRCVFETHGRVKGALSIIPVKNANLGCTLKFTLKRATSSKFWCLLLRCNTSILQLLTSSIFKFS